MTESIQVIMARLMCHYDNADRTRLEAALYAELAYVAQPVPPALGEPVYHLRQYGDVSKEQLDRYVATGTISHQLPVGGADVPTCDNPPMPAPERNFCETCGKRLSDSEYIHTCTPPESKA